MAARSTSAVKTPVSAASARELATDHLCLGMISPVATGTRNSASMSSMRLAFQATKPQKARKVALVAERGFRATAP